MKRRIPTLTTVILMTGAVSALGAIPEPDFILHGKVRVNGLQAQPADDVRVLAKVTVPRGNPPVPTEQVVGSYRIGDTPPAGNNYVLRIRLENLAVDGSTMQSTNAAVVGQSATLYVRRGSNGSDVPAGMVLLAAAGTIEARDLSIDICGMNGSNPANCSLDPRQPTDPNGSNPAGPNMLTLNFSCSVAGAGPSDFAISVTPQVGPPLSIGSVNAVGMTATLMLSPGLRVPPGAWTCFTHLPSMTRRCAGILPGDISLDGTTSALDLPLLVNALNRMENFPLTRSDMDRNGVFNSSDIRRLVELFDGAQAFDPWYDQTIGACPTPP